MKPYFKLAGSLFAILLVASCNKDVNETTPLASIKIVNTVAGGTTARLNRVSTTVPNSGATGGTNFGLLTGYPDIYVWPTTDSTKPYYNSGKTVAVEEGNHMTLFLGGTSTLPEGILVKESFQNYSDSVLGVRFVNLSPNSTPVNVTLSTSTNVNEFANISYKSVTDFKQYPAKIANTAYTFQVKWAGQTGTPPSVAISLTGTSALPRFKNITLVFRGMINTSGTTAPGITRVNHY